MKKWATLRPTLRNPVDCSPPGSSVHGILQARILEWVTMPSSRGSPDHGSNSDLLHCSQTQTHFLQLQASLRKERRALRFVVVFCFIFIFAWKGLCILIGGEESWGEIQLFKPSWLRYHIHWQSLCAKRFRQMTRLLWNESLSGTYNSTPPGGLWSWLENINALVCHGPLVHV